MANFRLADENLDVLARAKPLEQLVRDRRV